MGKENDKTFIPHDIKYNNYNYFSNQILNWISATMPEKTSCPQFYLENFPPQKKLYTTVRDRRLITEKTFGNFIKSNTDQLLFRRNTLNTQTSNNQIKYNFDDKISKVIIRGAEVNCRMITSSKMTGETRNNLFRIGNITFKGQMKKIMDDILTQCKKELEEKHNERDLITNGFAAYVNEHKRNTCLWPCEEIYKDLQNKNSHYQKIFSQSIDNKIPCFYTRQVLGQGFHPFIYKEEGKEIAGRENEQEEEEIEEKIEGYDTGFLTPAHQDYLFDNLMLDKAANLIGVREYQIPYNHCNFLDSVDFDACTALINFNLSYLGITQRGINIYLKLHDICFCTSVASEYMLPNAKSYLEKICYTNDSVQTYLINTLNVDKSKFEFIDFNHTTASNNKRKLNVQEKGKEEETAEIKNKQKKTDYYDGGCDFGNISEVNEQDDDDENDEDDEDDEGGIEDNDYIINNLDTYDETKNKILEQLF